MCSASGRVPLVGTASVRESRDELLGRRGRRLVEMNRGREHSLFTHEVGAALQQLFRNERREQHVAKLHERRDLRLGRQHHLGLTAHHDPLKALTVGTEAHSI